MKKFVKFNIINFKLQTKASEENDLKLKNFGKNLPISQFLKRSIFLDFWVGSAFLNKKISKFLSYSFSGISLNSSFSNSSNRYKYPFPYYNKSKFYIPLEQRICFFF